MSFSGEPEEIELPSSTTDDQGRPYSEGSSEGVLRMARRRDRTRENDKVEMIKMLILCESIGNERYSVQSNVKFGHLKRLYQERLPEKARDLSMMKFVFLNKVIYDHETPMSLGMQACHDIVISLKHFNEICD